MSRLTIESAGYKGRKLKVDSTNGVDSFMVADVTNT